MSDQSASAAYPGVALLALYDRALPQVYGYLLSRCGSTGLAEDLTSETFMAAVDAVRRDRVPDLTIAWLVGVARHKLVDHWRRQARQDRTLALVENEATIDGEQVDEWDVQLDQMRAHEVLAELSPDHRSVLTLRYLDGLSVSEVAGCIDRTVHATEALLVRARAAFRRTYGERGSDAD